MITLKFFATLRNITGKKEIVLEGAHNIEDALTKASNLIGVDLIKELFEENGTLKKAVVVLVNGRNILHIKGINTELKDGDTVSIFPPVGGG